MTHRGRRNRKPEYPFIRLDTLCAIFCSLVLLPSSSGTEELSADPIDSPQCFSLWTVSSTLWSPHSAVETVDSPARRGLPTESHIAGQHAAYHGVCISRAQNDAQQQQLITPALSQMRSIKKLVSIKSRLFSVLHSVASAPLTEFFACRAHVDLLRSSLSEGLSQSLSLRFFPRVSLQNSEKFPSRILLYIPGAPFSAKVLQSADCEEFGQVAILRLAANFLYRVPLRDSVKVPVGSSNFELKQHFRSVPAIRVPDSFKPFEQFKVESFDSKVSSRHRNLKFPAWISSPGLRWIIVKSFASF